VGYPHHRRDRGARAGDRDRTAEAAGRKRRADVRAGAGDHGQRCVSCYADKPTQEGFAAAPKDAKLDAPERTTANEQRIYEQVVATKAMPIGNLTGMPDAERATTAAWVAGGAGPR